MRLRTRLILAFTYILTVIIVALTVPLAFNLERRTYAELEGETLRIAQTLAGIIGESNLDDPRAVRAIWRQAELGTSVERIVVVDDEGLVTFDSARDDPVGTAFATTERPEMVAALDPVRPAPTAARRFSQELGRTIMVAAAPIIDEEVVGAVRLTRRIDEVEAAVRRTTLGLVAVGVAGLAAGVVIAFGLAGSLARPIQRLAGTAVRLGRGDLQARAGDVAGGREIRDLAASFDEMADRLERTVRAQREFVANASHQLRTPLTGMKLRLESAIAETDDERQRERLEAAEREVDRLSEIVDRLLAAAREIEEGAVTRTDLDEAVARAVERWGERAGQRGAAIRVMPSSGFGAEFTPRPEGGPAVGANDALANPADVDQILDNLLDNAIAYASGPIEVTTSADGARVAMAVRDHGPGIPEDERDRVTDRFYRGRDAPSGGTGLGLSIARELAEKWGGELAVGPAEGGGTRIVVRFRRAGSASTTSAAEPEARID
jgi:two-component system, OmpR family, sensor kinase